MKSQSPEITLNNLDEIIMLLKDLISKTEKKIEQIFIQKTGP